MIAIIEGCGANIASLQFALQRLGKLSVLTADAETIASASHVILPGVGSAQFAMQALAERRLIDVIRQIKQPFLGICLGMQLLFDHSAEGNTDCLAIIPGRVKEIPMMQGLSVPHMGWNKLTVNQPHSPLLSGVDEAYMYYVHGYAAPISTSTIATSTHGIIFTAVTQYQNYYGVQFHPEKSGAIGEKLLLNFLSM